MSDAHPHYGAPLSLRVEHWWVFSRLLTPAARLQHYCRKDDLIGGGE